MKLKNKKVESAKEPEKGKKTNNVRPSLKCKFYERGNCKNGEKCKYRHPDFECLKYASNECENGIFCEASHPRKDCLYWLRGDCSRGESCLFRHVRSLHGTKSTVTPPFQYPQRNLNSVWPNYKSGNIYEGLSFLGQGQGGRQSRIPIPRGPLSPPPDFSILPPPPMFPQLSAAPPMLYTDAVKMNNLVYTMV